MFSCHNGIVHAKPMKMKQKDQIFTQGYFSNDIARELLTRPEGGHPRPAAVHIESESNEWNLVAYNLKPEEKLRLTNHAIFCARILAGMPDQNPSWDTGLVDEYIQPGRMAFIASAIHPDVRVITISSVSNFLPSFGYRDYRDLSRPVVFAAAGNDADDWQNYQKTSALSGSIYMPGYMRVGEAISTGEVHSGSQISGPAFICYHPQNIKELGNGIDFNATEQDVRNFLDWPHHGISAHSRSNLKSYKPPESDIKEFHGTSASAPYAGALVMRYTADMSGISSYDIVPAVLMAAQINSAPYHAEKLIETQSGMIFDPFQYGHGILVEECLRESLRDVWEIRASSGQMTKGGHYSLPVTVEGRGYMSASTEKAQGPVVNTVLVISFCNDESDPEVAESRIPEFLLLKSPQGTLIHLPILYDRKNQYGPYIRAGYQTAAFFGEYIHRGQWQVFYSVSNENPLRIASMKVIAHTMHEKSPANILFKAFQKTTGMNNAASTTVPVSFPKLDI